MNQEEQFVDAKCPSCGQGVSFPESLAGILQECAFCGECLIVPSSSTDTCRRPPIPFSTPRLTLRPFDTDDSPDLYEVVSNPELWKFNPGQGMEETEVERWIQEARQTKLTSQSRAYYLAIALQDPNKVVGYARLSLHDPFHPSGEISLSLHPGHWRRGLGHEAALGLLAFCFAGLRLRRVFGNCDSRNTAARQFAAKLGFRQEAEFIQDRLTLEGYSNTVWFAMLKEEYDQRGANPG